MKRDLTERVNELIVNVTVIQRAANWLAQLCDRLIAQTMLRPLKLIANGTWLEHPLHPLLTDVPVGAWTVAILLDVIALIFGVPNLGLATGVVIGFGVLAALATIAAGLMDWMDVDPPELSIGLIHGIVNTTATILFAVSFFWRWMTDWIAGLDKFILTLAGYLLLTFGAYLGGTLVYRLGVMVNRNAFRSGPKGFVAAMPIGDLPENQFRRAEVKGNPVLLWRRGDKILAVGAVCSHYSAPLEQGKLVGNTVQCPFHASRFSLEDGSVKEGPATCPLPAYEARVVDGQVQVKARDYK